MDSTDEENNSRRCTKVIEWIFDDRVFQGKLKRLNNVTISK